MAPLEITRPPAAASLAAPRVTPGVRGPASVAGLALPATTTAAARVGPARVISPTIVVSAPLAAPSVTKSRTAARAATATAAAVGALQPAAVPTFDDRAEDQAEKMARKTAAGQGKEALRAVQAFDRSEDAQEKLIRHQLTRLARQARTSEAVGLVRARQGFRR